MKIDMDREIEAYYASQSLATDRVQKIIAAGDMVIFPTWRRHLMQGSVAAGMAASLILLLAFLFGTGGSDLSQTIAAEISDRHKEALDPEVYYHSFEEIQAALPKLNFPITPTKLGMLEGYNIVGGRYCCVSDEMAAHIALKNDNGKRSTLYIAPLTETLLQTKPCVLKEGDVNVQLWHDEHRLFALATPARPH